MGRDRTGSFPAKFAGTCGGCGERFAEGAGVRYDEDDVLLAVGCCGRPDTESFESQLFPPPRQARDLAALTMPRGKTAQDRCGVCFQVPAVNGVCGCC